MKKILYSLFSIFVISSCLQFRTNNKKTHRFFEKKNQTVVIQQINGLRVIKSDRVNKKTAILFIHGMPNSSDAFYEYLADSLLLTQATLISYDRLGYGYSSYGTPEVSIKKQAEAICPIIEKYETVYLVGHSYGGAITVYLALISKNVNKIVLIAPALYPHKERFYNMAKFGTTQFGRLFSSKALFVASSEKIAHQKSIEEIDEAWGALSCGITYIHSTNDPLVPYKNIDYLDKTFKNSRIERVTLQEGGHFLPANHFELVRNLILKAIKEPKIP